MGCSGNRGGNTEEPLSLMRFNSFCPRGRKSTVTSFIFLPAINPPLVPHAEVQQGPQVKAPILRAAPVLVEQARDKLIIEEVAPPHGRVHQVRVEPAAEAIAEPLAHGRSETTLLTVEQVVRQNLFERAF